jgi:hypothetical protein
MLALFDLFWDICLLRKGPEDVPASLALLKLSLLVYGITGLLIMLVSMELAPALLQTALDMALLGGLTYGVLSRRGYRTRFVQTLTALAGVGALLASITLPVVFWMDKETVDGSEAGLPLLVFLLLLGWSIAVVSHILQHALSISRNQSILYTLGYLFISMLLSKLLLLVS